MDNPTQLVPKVFLVGLETAGLATGPCKYREDSPGIATYISQLLAIYGRITIYTGEQIKQVRL